VAQAAESSSPPTATTQGAEAAWSDAEQIVARCAFDRAQQRAIRSLVDTVQAHARDLDSVESVWMLHDYLSTQRHAIEGRFDFRLAGLLIVFAALVRDGLLSMDELAGLDATKLAKIAALSKF
jgi:hypothetical protein